jgi:predicted HTH domain antitoxin
MSDVISTRLKKEEIEELNEISAKEHLDRSALMRKFLLQQIKEYRLKNVSERYRKGIISLAEAAILAKVTIYDMMEYCKREQIRPIEPDSFELRMDRTNAEEIFHKLKEEK